MLEFVVAEEHSQLFDLWAQRGCRGLAVCHVDFHCDMRGLLIDRRRGRARFVWQSDPFMARLDSGSFLAHAVMNGVVSRLRWVHDDFGGRKFDDLYCVKYERDFSALPFLFAGKKKWVPLEYKDQTFADWGGPSPGEHLCIDWDGIAYVDYEMGHVRRLMEEILGRDFQPESLFVARSPEYCHQDEELFDEFIAKLEKKFGARATRLPAKRHPPMDASFLWRIYHGIENRILRQARKLGIY